MSRAENPVSVKTVSDLNSFLLHHCKVPPLRGREHPRFIDSLYSKEATKVRGFTITHHILLANYSIGMEIGKKLYKHTAVDYG